MSEAQYIALAKIVKVALYIRQVQQPITPNEDNAPIQVVEGNEGGTKLPKNPLGSKRTQLIGLKDHFVRDTVLAKK